MKKLFVYALALSLSAAMVSCGGEQKPAQNTTESTPSQDADEAEDEGDDAADDAKGIGPIKEVNLTHPLDQGMVKGGKEIYDLKCSSCHKLDNTKLVGPGWKDVTKRRKPEWIMNFVTNVDEMLNKDPEAMAMLEECLVRMPNQNLTEKDARNLLEFMRNNDGDK
jgi:mono/diheme cytochrome c family protein